MSDNTVLLSKDHGGSSPSYSTPPDDATDGLLLAASLNLCQGHDEKMETQENSINF